MVSGGTYGTEDIIHGAGYGRGLLILLLTPLLWSLPTALMLGELSSAIPAPSGAAACARAAGATAAAPIACARTAGATAAARTAYGRGAGTATNLRSAGGPAGLR